MVGSFHGHAHNRACQLRWHPTYIQGTGHSEGEGCEQIFSSSNDLARAARHATRFHRHQMIEEHFHFWDEDKYANLSAYYPSLPHDTLTLFSGQFIGNHYRAAVDTIRTPEAELEVLQHQLGLTKDDFYDYLEAERKYLEELKSPSPLVLRKIQYVQALNDLRKCQYVQRSFIQRQAKIYIWYLERNGRVLGRPSTTCL